jgi:hypothetical protein
MRSQKGRTDRNFLSEDLEKLQRKWDAKTAKLADRGRGLWAHGVVFGIETGLRRLAEGKAGSPTELNAVLDEWKGVGKRKATGPAAASIKGIDFGVRLVIGQVRRYLKRLARQKQPALAPVRLKPPTSCH